MASPGGSQLLANLFSRLKAEWPPAKWEWDGRLGCALTTLNQSTEAKGRELLSANLRWLWTRSTLGQAPALVQQTCARTGGLMGAQMVFSADLEGIVAFCLWWPWGDGTTFSARIGALSADAGVDLRPGVRAAFGV